MVNIIKSILQNTFWISWPKTQILPEEYTRNSVRVYESTMIMKQSIMQLLVSWTLDTVLNFENYNYELKEVVHIKSILSNHLGMCIPNFFLQYELQRGFPQVPVQ